MASLSPFLVLWLGTLPFLSSLAEGYPVPPLADGLSWNFYESTCPEAESIIRSYLEKAIHKDTGLAAGLIRITFHDCFVQGCDGSVLLDGTASDSSEKDSPPNLSLRATAFAAINETHDLLEESCGRVVSCSDIVQLAGRDSVVLSGGPFYRVPMGRRDSPTYASNQTVLQYLPSPTLNTTGLIAVLAQVGLDVSDLVALSGTHTVGISHCSSFINRLYPTQDPVMEKTYAKHLYATCPTNNSTNTTVLDIRTPYTFDHKYYVDLVNRQGLFTSVQDLYTDHWTRGIVTSFALDKDLFFEKLIYSTLKMGQLSVLTGSEGQIRANPTGSSDGSQLGTVVEEGQSSNF